MSEETKKNNTILSALKKIVSSDNPGAEPVLGPDPEVPSSPSLNEPGRKMFPEIAPQNVCQGIIWAELIGKPKSRRRDRFR